MGEFSNIFRAKLRGPQGHGGGWCHGAAAVVGDVESAKDGLWIFVVK